MGLNNPSTNNFGTTSIAIFSNQQASGTGGGNIVTASVWITSPINNTDLSQTWSSLSSNQITLTSGTYYFDVYSPVYAIDHFQTRLQNITDTTTSLLGSSDFANSGSGCEAVSFIKGQITIAATKTFQIQLNNTTGNLLGFGQPAGFGTEVYCRVVITKIA